MMAIVPARLYVMRKDFEGKACSVMLCFDGIREQIVDVRLRTTEESDVFVWHNTADADINNEGVVTSFTTPDGVSHQNEEWRSRTQCFGWVAQEAPKR